MQPKYEEPILSCRNVTKLYGSLAAVDGATLNVNAGEVIGIGGPNGAGKTTLFDIISGVTPVTSGQVIFQGHDITTLRAHKVCKAGLARTFQLNAAFDSMTVEQNVLCSAHFGRRDANFLSLSYDRATRDYAHAAIEMTGLGNQTALKVSELTAIQRKRLMIACAIASKPTVLLLDEPVGGLTATEIDEAIELIRNVKRELSLTIVIIEHVMRFLVALCDRVVIMHLGKKIFEGPASDLSRDKNVVEVYLGAAAAKRLEATTAGKTHHV